MDWRNRDANQPDLAADAPTLLVIHGLNGHSEEACVVYSMVCCTLVVGAPCAALAPPHGIEVRVSDFLCS